MDWPGFFFGKNEPLIALKGLIGAVDHARKICEERCGLESMIVAELREYPECESAAVVVIGPPGVGWEAQLAATSATIDVDCEEKLAAITNRLRQQFDLAE